MNDVSTGAWEPDGTGVHPTGTSFTVRFRNRGVPAARITLDVSACDLDDGGLGVYTIPSFIVYADPAAACQYDPDRTVSWTFEDTDPLPGSYETVPDADQAALELATALEAGGVLAAIERLGSDLAILIFSWDGQPPE